jgi:hypothetical protein
MFFRQPGYPPPGGPVAFRPRLATGLAFSIQKPARIQCRLRAKVAMEVGNEMMVHEINGLYFDAKSDSMAPSKIGGRFFDATYKF